MKTRLATSVVALSTALATPSLADVSAADVIANQQALYEAMGITMSGELSGSQFVNPEFNIVLPQGVASLRITMDDFLIADNGDGSVTMSYPSPMTIRMAGGVKNEGSFEADVTITHEGYSIVATGDAGDVTYSTQGSNLRMDMGDLSFDGSEEISAEGFVLIEDISGTARITEGNVITVTSTSLLGNSEGDFTITADNIVSENTQTTGPMQATMAMTLPVGGSDLMNLSQAFRDGLSIVIESTGEGSTSTAVTTLDGEVLNRQNTSTGPQTASMTLGEGGFTISAEANGFEATFFDQLIFPADLEFAMGSLTADYDVPLNASEEAQDFRIATSMSDITLGDTIWNMFDPAGQLPRDPAEVSFDVTGTGTNGMDLLDFAAMAGLYGPPPIEVDEVTIENLRISALGAEAMAQGAFTFDWTDFQTIPGIARPEGEVTINLNGANKLLETLSAMGLIPEEELMMPRMMMGMFATPVGDDMLQSVIEVNEEGHVLANGQRLR